MEQKQLTNQDKVNIFKSDINESERLYSEGQFAEAFRMLSHASKNFISNKQPGDNV